MDCYSLNIVPRDKSTETNLKFSMICGNTVFKLNLFFIIHNFFKKYSNTAVADIYFVFILLND